ncbi:Prefoldin subunit 4, partial [Fasciolopsis buskii]
FVPQEDIEVTHQDQQRINNFATWNLKYKDYIGEHEQKKKDLENLNDAEDELILSDCDSHRFLIGETFFHLSTDEVNEELNSAKDATRMRMTELDELISESKAKMQTLKRELYAKFGTHINLEED